MPESSNLGSKLNSLWEERSESTITKSIEEERYSSTNSRRRQNDVDTALIEHINKMEKEHNSQIQQIKDNLNINDGSIKQLKESLDELKVKVEKFDDFKTYIVLGGLLTIIAGAWALYSHLDSKYEDLGLRVSELSVQIEKNQSQTNSSISELAENLRLLRLDSEKLDKIPGDIQLLNHQVNNLRKSQDKLEDKLDDRVAKQ
ncbi:TPA: hypothetical protein ACN34M_000004 [Vibrio parahaemolyticus]